MRTIINNSNGDLGTAVFYGWHKFIPKDIEISESTKEFLLNECRAKKIQYKGNRSYSSLRDFSEHNFLFDINKYKFNDKFLINLLSEKSKNLVGKKLDDLEKIEKIIFPSVSEEDTDYEDEFFGSTLISNQTLIVLEANGSTSSSTGIWKIELYEEGVMSNNTSGGFIEEELLDEIEGGGIEKTSSPIITIFLGPEPEVKNNSSSMYFSNDPRLISKENNESLSLTEYRKLYEEITMNKSVWILLALDNTVTSINLSYKSWIDNINPNRNMKDFIIRNDEFFSTKDYLSIIEKDKNSNYWYDRNSETLVGSKVIDNHPILTSKLKKYKDNSTVYSPFAEYNIGDRVTFDGKTWESLCSHNLGNSPTLSNNWTISSNIDNIFTSRVVVIPYPNNGGYSNPGGIITVNSNSLISFKIYESPGYSINESTPCSYEVGNNLTNYILTVNRDPSIGNEITLTVGDWTKSIESGKLYINFSQIKSTITLMMSDGESEVPYDQWISYYSDSSLILSSLEINGEEVNPAFNDNYEILAYIDDKISLIFPIFKKYTINKLKSTYIINNSVSEKFLDIENNGMEIITSDVVNYTSTIYTLLISPKEFTVYAIGDTNNFEISNSIGKTSYGSNYKLYFYNTENNFKSAVISFEQGSYISYSVEELGVIKIIENTEIMITLDSSENYLLEFRNVESNIEITLKE